MKITRYSVNVWEKSTGLSSMSIDIQITNHDPLHQQHAQRKFEQLVTALQPLGYNLALMASSEERQEIIRTK